MKRLLLLFALIIISISCTKKADLGDFDTDKWKADLNGCKGDRAEMVKDLLEVKPNVLGLYQKSVIAAFGQPEEEELYKRSQTYYIYHIDPSEDCESSVEDPRVLRIRFTSLGIANEVNIR